MSIKEICYTIELTVDTTKPAKTTQLEILTDLNIDKLHDLFADVCELDALRILRVI